MTKMIELRGVRKDFAQGKHRISVLQHIDLDVDDGEFLALMGPSGSGKSTLLNLIGGLDVATAGTVQVAGRRLNGLGSDALAKWRATSVGFVFQSYNLMPMLSAWRNVELPLLLTRLGAAERQNRAHIALQLVGLSDRAEHKPSELSGGEQQRVAVARAVVSDPMLLLCDEPTGDLDRQSAEQILTLLRTLNREHGKTVLMVTHDPKAAAYAERTVYLDKGKLVPPAAIPGA